MKKYTLFCAFALLVFNVLSAQTVFDFDTNAVDNGDDSLSQTIDDMVVTIVNNTSTADGDTELADGTNFGGTSGNVALIHGASATFTFNEAVDVNSIIAVEAGLSDITFTFTPIGGSNALVEVSLVGGEAPIINLNWINVTAFTVTSSGAAMGFDDLSVSPSSGPPTIVFDFEENAVWNPDANVIQTIDDISVTVTGDDPFGIFKTCCYDFGGLIDNVFFGGAAVDEVTFTFSEAVHVNSVNAAAASWQTVDYTFIPTGGDNSPVVASIVDGVSPLINFNWTGVTSFTVLKSTRANLLIDNLTVSIPVTASVSDSNISEAIVYPNPVENTINIKNVSDLKSVGIYNNLGQLLLQSKKECIDVSHLSKGVFFLQIHTNFGTETKRVIKK